jgi:peptidoglycan/LPS O-acetylase OafA/YrhL
LKYRSDIDGLRAVAVLAVIAFHYRLPFPEPFRLEGGFTGVDVFFVISGFLITSVLTQDVQDGRFSVLSFYDRRIRRIVPALAVVLTATLLAGKFLLMPGDYSGLSDSAAAAAFGASNFYFLSHTGYFDQTADLLPLLHTWSLGVEEQFYLLWPLLLAFIVGRRKKIDTVAIITTITIIGFGASLVWFDQSPKSAFYLPFPRAWELSTGALLVFMPKLPRAAGELTTVAGLALILFGFIRITEAHFPGASALLPCLGAALVIWPRHETGVSARQLGRLAPIGLISYSLYLWHWPVWVFYRTYINGAEPRIRETLMLAAVSIALAAVSYRYVERPFRKPRWMAARNIQLGLTAALAIFCVAMFVDSAGGLPSRISPQAMSMRSLNVMWQWSCRGYIQINGIAHCEFGAPWKGHNRKAILWGDSHAEHLAPILDAVGRQEDVSFILQNPCPAAFGTDVFRRWPELGQHPSYETMCTAGQNTVSDLVAKDPDIDFVVLATSWWGLLTRDIYSTKPAEAQQSKASLIVEGLEETIRHIQRPGLQIVIVGDMASPLSHLQECEMARISGLFRRQCDPRDMVIGSKHERQVFGPIDNALAKMAGREGITFVRPSDKMCNASNCLTHINGEFLFRDGIHLRRNLSPATDMQLAKILGFDRIFAASEH